MEIHGSIGYQPQIQMRVHQVLLVSHVGAEILLRMNAFSQVNEQMDIDDC